MDLHWKELGACVPWKDPSIWYSDSPTDQDVARSICAECPVKAECLEYALDHENYGMWAGTSERGRRRIRSQRRRQLAVSTG